MSQTNPWQSELTVSEDLAEKLINDQFQNLLITSIERLGAGWDNVAYLINKHYVFRFPARSLAENLMKEELKILPAIQNRLPLEIPNLVFIGHPSATYPWHFSGYTCLPGKTACSVALTDKERGQCAKSLALFLKRLHSAPLTMIAKSVSLARDIREKANPKVRVPQAINLLESLVNIGLIEQSEKLNHFFDSCLSITNQYTPYLIHGDLYVRHLLVDDNQQLCGVIDWGDAHLGHKGVDLSIVYGFLPKESHDIFWEHYGEVSENTKKIAQMRSLYSSLMLIDYGHKIHDQDLVREGLWTIHQFVA